MALTMTRNRTQTALTTFAVQIANVHGELEFIARLLETRSDDRHLLEGRRRHLESVRDALYVTVRQFDAKLRPEDIGSLAGWMKPYGRNVSETTVRRYTTALRGCPQPGAGIASKSVV